MATLSALTGSFSHILLDGLMHADMYPFYPFSQTQFLLNLIPYSFIFYGCFIGFIFGGILFLLHEK